MRALLQAVNTFFSTWRFPVFTVSTLGFTALMLLGILAIPPSDDALGAFAEDFKVWCFGYDPATGQIEWAFVGVFVLQPLALALVTAAIWSDTFREAVARPRQAVPYAVGGFGLVFLSAVAMAAMQPEARPQGELPFPADSLRTEIVAPEISLVDHRGQPVVLSSLRGKVVVVTAVYASCGLTCPTILQQAKGAMAELTPEEQQQVVVLGISLDAARDTPERLAALAEGQGLPSAGWHLLTGDPAYTEATLRDLGWAWTVDPETGRIDHANLFLLVDREGRIAYRLGLGDRQQRWLVSALKALLAEEAG